jgi:hypothetical protein
VSDEEQSHLSEYRARLDSDDIDVVCGALNDYQRAQADSRWGMDNPYWPLDNEVRLAASELLRHPASDGGHHESALTALWHLAEDEDADVIADILEDTTDPVVRQSALEAAGTALAAGEEPNRRLVALVIAMALDESVDVQDRKNAMRALQELDLREVEDLMVGLTESPELGLQVCAASWLATPLRLRVHRDRLRRLAESWPKDVDWEARRIRDELKGFHSAHWVGTELAEPALRDAHAELMFPHSDDGCGRAFTTLLRSQDPVAVGIALDHYESSDGLRHVLADDERFEAHLPEVLARAREVLRRPMSPAEVSALDMIGARYAEPGDADLLLDVLTRTHSDEVRSRACWMAHGVLTAAEVVDERLVAALGEVILDSSAGIGAKEMAIRVLADSLGADADGPLLHALREGEPKVQAHVAVRLVRSGGLDRHRAILEEVAENWGERPPCRPWGEDPNTLIFGSPHSIHWENHRLTDRDLHRAHKRLRAATVDDSYHQALRTLLESNDHAAVGIALDHWSSPDGAVKRGGVQARQPERALVVDRIREVLRRPSSRAESSLVALLHLSALSALEVVAADEQSLVAEIVAAPVSQRVRLEAIYALDPGNQDARKPDPRLIETLGTVACAKHVPLHYRFKALELLGGFSASGSVAALVRATRCPEVEIQAAAACELTRDEIFEDHRAMLADLSANWPVEDAPWRVAHVLDKLNTAKE